jgi:predicted nucleic acid-binding protein
MPPPRSAPTRRDAREARSPLLVENALSEAEKSVDATTIVLAALVIVLLAVVGWLLYERQRSDRLRSDFGPEYRRTVDQTGDRRAAEAELEQRRRRVAALEIRPLSASDRARYEEAWRRVQTRFVDDPTNTIDDADQLIGEVMEARGYPVADFDQRVADVSVGHPMVVEHYRLAHAIATGDDRSRTDTEQLRQAMVHYRALFQDLVEGPDRATKPASASDTAQQPALTRRTP